MGGRRRADPDIAHHPRFGIHGGVELPRPGDSRPKKPAEGGIPAAVQRTVIVVADNSRLEIFGAITKSRLTFARAIVVPGISNASTGGETLKEPDVGSVNRRRYRQKAAVVLCILDQTAADLSQVVPAARQAGLLAGARNDGKKKRDQKGDERDYDQQLGKCEPRQTTTTVRPWRNNASRSENGPVRLIQGARQGNC